MTDEPVSESIERAERAREDVQEMLNLVDEIFPMGQTKPGSGDCSACGWSRHRRAYGCTSGEHVDQQRQYRGSR
jgi:hypothetical protein